MKSSFEVDDGARLWLDETVAGGSSSGPVAQHESHAAKRSAGRRSSWITFKAAWNACCGCAGTPSQIHELANTKSDLNNAMETYLPQGADCMTSGRMSAFTGDKRSRKNCPLDILPLYVRPGTICPWDRWFNPPLSSLMHPTKSVFIPAPDGRFTIYEDDNETLCLRERRAGDLRSCVERRGPDAEHRARKGSFPA